MQAAIHLIHEFDFNETGKGPSYGKYVLEGDIVYSDGTGIRIRDKETRQLWWIPNSNVRVVKVLDDE